MVELTKELLLRVAANARLELSDEEVDKLLPQFKEILKAFAKIAEADVADTEPSFQPIKIENVWRDDVVGVCQPRNAVLKLTSHKKSGYFLGPRAI